MKTATDNTDDSKIVQTTTTRRVFPSEMPAPEKKDFWDYLEQISDWDRHLLYIYRRISDTGPSPQMEKCSGYITMRDGTQVALNNREEVEYAISKKYGGGSYRLILKRGPERVAEGRVLAEGPSLAAQPIAEPSQGSNYVSEGSSTADVAHHAINTIASQEKQGMQVGMDALVTAAQVIKNFTQAPAASATDDVTKQFVTTALQRAMNPPDQIETFIQFMKLQRELNPPGANGAGSNAPLVDRIVNAAVEKFLNAPPAGGSSSASAELIRQLPSVANYVTDAIREWRLGVEAQRDTAAIMMTKPAQLGSGQTRPPAAPPPLAQPTANPATTPNVEFLETKLMEIFREPTDADEAADKAIAFLDRMDATLPGQMAVLGEVGLLQLFQRRPILQPATQNMVRLQDFIKAFLKYAQEDEADPGAAKPN